jgi:hypothetical protein
VIPLGVTACIATPHAVRGLITLWSAGEGTAPPRSEGSRPLLGEETATNEEGEPLALPSAPSFGRRRLPSLGTKSI